MCPDITSRQHRIVAAFKSAARREGELVLLDGWHLLHEAFASRLEIVRVAVSGAPAIDRDRRLLERLSDVCDVLTVTPPVMDALSPAHTPAGVVALARPRVVAVRDLLLPAPALVLVAVDVQDPGNAGAIVRSAEAGGATGVVLTGASADPWGWKALRAAMGSTFRVAVRRDPDAVAVLDALRAANLTLIATTPHAGTSMHDAHLRRPIAIILGGEGAGLEQSLLDRSNERISIPMNSSVESLNVAVAGALLVYEARRQREQGGG